MKKEAFTLLELIIVIIILGVLVTLGFTQYIRMVEKARGAEAKQILGDIRKLAIAYCLANGAITGISNRDLNIGTGSDMIPSTCNNTHYFSYFAYVEADGVHLNIGANRCQSGGKSPDWSGPAGASLRLHACPGGEGPTCTERWENAYGGFWM